MSTDRIALVDLVTAEPVAGTERPDGADHFVLEALAALKVSFGGIVADARAVRVSG